MTVLERTLINTEQFAMRFAEVATQQQFSNQELTGKAKQFLLSYLTAYYLANDFNQIEHSNFTQATDKHFADMSFAELLDNVRNLNKY